MKDTTTYPRLRLRLHFGPGRWIGPGKADLLQAIAETGSIAAAGRRMGMSYNRAWNLVEVLNATFAAPLVESARGGAAHGGAGLTSAGREVLDRYRSLEDRAGTGGAGDIARLAALASKPD